MVSDKLKEMLGKGIQEITFQKNIITHVGFEEMNQHLLSNKLPRIPNWFPNEWECTHESYQGNLTTRYKKYLHYLGKKADEQIIAKLGEIARRHTSDHSTLKYDVTQDFDWDSGEYGEGRHSCFWTNKKAAKKVLEENDTYAIRIYNSTKGRAWILPDRPMVGSAVIFNVYWLRQPQLVGIVADLLNLKYKKWKIVNNGVFDGMLHINNGWGWLLSESFEFSNPLDLKIDDHSIGKCIKCGHTLWDDLDQYDVREDGIHCIACITAERG